MDRHFGAEDIAVVRHEVADRLATAGLSDDRLHGFVLAVNEVITNVVLHGGGVGHVMLRTTDCSARCTVTDDGAGMSQRLRGVPDVPSVLAVGGRGIWLAYQLCDEVTIESDARGTTIDLWMDLAAGDVPSDLANRAPAAG